MKIGIRAHDIGKYSIEELASKVNEYGFDSVQLVLNKAVEGESGLAGTLTEKKVANFYKALSANNVDVAMLGAYFNPIHSDKDKVKATVDKFKEHLQYANQFGAKGVGTETGSYNDDKWTYNPKNHTQEALDEVINVVKDLVEVAQNYNSYVIIEMAYHHVVSNKDRFQYLLDEIKSDRIKATIDIYNLLYTGNYTEYKEIFVESVKQFKDIIEIFHLKDFVLEDDKLKQVGLGQGYFDYEFIINTIKEHCPNATLIFEGVTGDDIVTSLDLVKKLCK